MSFTCFFGTKMAPGESVTPPMPNNSSLVITSLCVGEESLFGASVTVFAQVPNLPTRLALGTLHPDVGIYHLTGNFIFDVAGVTFYATPNLFSAGKPPTAIHLTGYYEAGDEDDADSVSDAEAEKEHAEDEFVPVGGRGKKAPKHN